ncbi:MAG: hypothetical protein V1774_03920 [Candidatus Eisenbacteria bacterium]
MSEVRLLVDEYRERCLWFLRPDYYPETIDEALRVLRAIETHGDAAAFRRAAALRQWFLLHSSEKSAG